MTTRMQRVVRRALVACAILALIVAVAVYSARTPGAKNDARAAAPPPRVTVQTIAPRKVRVWSEFSGRLRAVDSAEIRPEVGGRITGVLFEDGQTVKAGDVLFIIDPRPYEAAVARAQAALASARSNDVYAKAELERAATLVRTQAVAQRVYDERANASRVAAADIEAAAAQLRQAELDLDHAYVRAPISGRASRAEITLGNLVQPGPGAPLLTTIVSDQSIYADFEVDEQTFVESIRGYAVGNDRNGERRIPVLLSVQEDPERIYRGTIYTFDNRIDVSSGTIRARAKFDNADRMLIPGMYVSIKLADGPERDRLLVPDSAIGFDQSKQFVYVVGDGNKVTYRQVELGKQVGTQRIALAGLRPGDRVIVDGIQHVRPDLVVDATEAAPGTVSQAAPSRDAASN
jgi:membrane fusion protein, multidrug efflux system